MNDKAIPVAIAGMGRSGRWNHAEVLAGMPDKFSIVGASDTDTLRREEAAAKYGCAVFESFGEMIAQSHARLIVVASPSHLHFTQTIHALQSGKGVICEKPMALNLAEVDSMIETARVTGQLLTVFHNSRYSADFRKIAQVIASGVLGRIIQIRIRWNRFGRRWDWQTLRKYGGGTLNNTIPHPLDQILSLFPMEDPRIFFHSDKAISLGDTEDHVKLLLQSPEMPLLDLEASNADGAAGPRWTVLGTSGHLQGGENRVEWKYFDPKDLPERHVSQVPSSDLTYNQENIPWTYKEWTAPLDTPSNSELFYRSLHTSILQGKKPEITGSQVRMMMSILQHCQHRLNHPGCVSELKV